MNAFKSNSWATERYAYIEHRKLASTKYRMKAFFRLFQNHRVQSLIGSELLIALQLITDRTERIEHERVLRICPRFHEPYYVKRRRNFKNDPALFIEPSKRRRKRSASAFT